MKLILQKDVKNLGKTGDQVSVKAGFARNFLIPKGYAFLLNKDHLKTWSHQKFIIEAKKKKAVSERKQIIDKLSSIKLVFEKEIQKKSDKIFGSVTAHEISQALEEKHNISVDKKDIHFSELKTTGNHKVSICLDSDLKTEILLSIKGKIRKKKEEPLAPKSSEEKKNEDLTEKTDVLFSLPEPQTSISKAESSTVDSNIKEKNQQSEDSLKQKTSLKKDQIDNKKPAESQKLEDTKNLESETAGKEDKIVSKEDKKPEKESPQDKKEREEKLQVKEEVKDAKPQMDSSSADKAKEKKSDGFFKKLFGK